MMLASEEAARISAYLDVTTPLPASADLMFVFGTGLLTPAQIAAELYVQGRAPFIVLTGSNQRTGVDEADAHARFLLEAGVPAEALVIENRSTTTHENVTFAIPLIEEKRPLASLRSVLAICKWMHSRRALMTLKRQMPRGVRYYACTYEPLGVTRENWYLEPQRVEANVLKDWQAIPQYLAQGQLEEIVRDGDTYV